MQSWLVDLYSISPFSSWLLFVLVLTVVARVLMIPLGWRAFRRQQILGEQATAIAELHNRYGDDPAEYETAFREFKRITGVRTDHVITDYAAILLPLGFLGFLLFRSYSEVAKMPDELGLGLTDLVVLGDLDAVWLVVAMSLALGLILAWSTKNLPEQFQRYRWLIITIPVLIQVLIYSTIPLYFNIYIAFSILFGVVQSMIFRRHWGDREPVVIDLETIADVVAANKKS